MIQHTVAFALKHEPDSQGEEAFLAAARVLEQIPTVRNFQCLRQVGKKNNFAFGLSMYFESDEAYQEYNAHLLHTEFVNSRWVLEVTDFLEIDYTPYEKL